MPDIQEVTVDDLKHLVSDRAIQGETMLLNMGPQHPSTHGVLRLLLELDGETVVNCIPDIGFLHTGIEKNMEAKTYQKAEVMSDRLDYMNTVGNNLAYSLAVEKLVDLDVPARAQAIRVILTELHPFPIAPGLAGHVRPRPGSHVHVPVLLPRTRVHPGCHGDVLRPAHDDHLHPPRRAVAGCAGRVRSGCPEHPQDIPETDRRVRSAADPQPAHARPHLGIGKLTGEECLNFGVTGPMLRASGVKWDLRKDAPLLRVRAI